MCTSHILESYHGINFQKWVATWSWSCIKDFPVRNSIIQSIENYFNIILLELFNYYGQISRCVHYLGRIFVLIMSLNFQWLPQNILSLLGALFKLICKSQPSTGPILFHWAPKSKLFCSAADSPPLSNTAKENRKNPLWSTSIIPSSECMHGRQNNSHLFCFKIILLFIKCDTRSFCNAKLYLQLFTGTSVGFLFFFKIHNLQPSNLFQSITLPLSGIFVAMIRDERRRYILVYPPLQEVKYQVLTLNLK